MSGKTTTTGIAGMEAESGISGERRHSGVTENIGINCPSCGGSLSIEEGLRSTECEYCGSSLYIYNPRGVKRYYREPEITAGKAKLRALNLLDNKSGGRIGARHTSVVDLRLIHVPFWRMKGMFLGWICGEEYRNRTVEKCTSTPNGEIRRTDVEQEKRPFSKFISRNINWSAPACVMRHLGLQGISFRSMSGEWKQFDHSLKRSMNIALVTVPRKKAESDGFRHTVSLAKPSGSRIDAGRYHMFDRRLSIYYYPVYLLYYSYKDIIYEITIDGTDGHIIRADIPDRKKINPASYFFVPAAAALLAGTWFPLIFIALFLLYGADSVRGGRMINPLSWIKLRLQNAFGRG
jgi:DNA-directed RNA polymerase subunit RPC12/RpoP